MASLLAPHTVKSQKSENFTFGKTVEIRLPDQGILKPSTYLISFYLIVAPKMPKSTKSSKASKSRKSASKPLEPTLQQQLERLDYERHQALTFVGATFSYYPSSRVRTKISAQGAYKGLRSKTVDVEDEEEKEEDISEEEEKEENEHMKDEEVNDETENEYDEMYGDEDDEIDDHKSRTSIYLSFKKTKTSEVSKGISRGISEGISRRISRKISKEISRENDEELTILPSVESPVVEASKEALIKSKKQRSQLLPILDVNDDEVMANATYLMNVVVKYEEFLVHENVMMPTYKKNNALDFESFYLEMTTKGKRHADGFDYTCHLVKASAGVNWHRQAKNQSSVIRLNTNYGMISADAWSKILMLVMKTVNEKKKNVRINAE